MLYRHCLWYALSSFILLHHFGFSTLLENATRRDSLSRTEHSGLQCMSMLLSRNTVMKATTSKTAFPWDVTPCSFYPPATTLRTEYYIHEGITSRFISRSPFYHLPVLNPLSLRYPCADVKLKHAHPQLYFCFLCV
jgi:hypothetical protein